MSFQVHVVLHERHDAGVGLDGLPAISSTSSAFCLMAGILDFLLVLGCSGKPRERISSVHVLQGPLLRRSCPHLDVGALTHIGVWEVVT